MIVRVDVDTTRRMYRAIQVGDTETCSCADCRYFAAHREDAYTREYLQLLESMGIDWRKENETTCGGGFDEWRQYDGNFDFVGTVRVDGDSPHMPDPRDPSQAFLFGFTEGAGWPWTALRARDLGFAPIASVWFMSRLLSG
ncbi:MAG: hypothetical protein JOZ24_02160 [Candidatus Eremiobacteraeota bacterium]|nr:hypothetical protein [Candidatus Eremiobacteraeota bacterium]